MKITNALGLPAPFVSAVEREYTYTPKRYSVTSVLKGVREAILTRRHDDELETDVADMIWLIFGTAVHSVLENAQETPEQLKENKVEWTMPNGYVLSGIFDLYDDAIGTVTDYKTGSVWKAIYDEWDDYRDQTLIYCWILRQYGFNAHTGEVVLVMKDHSKSKAKHDRDYPQYPVMSKCWHFEEEDFEWIEKHLIEVFERIQTCEMLSDDALPVCTPEERWAKPDTWAAKKPANKRATKVFEDEAAAIKFAEENNLVVEYRPGEDVKCDSYCSCNQFCNYYLEKKGEKDD